jgi:hypothetical protein
MHAIHKYKKKESYDTSHTTSVGTTVYDRVWSK